MSDRSADAVVKTDQGESHGIQKEGVQKAVESFSKKAQSKSEGQGQKVNSPDLRLSEIDKRLIMLEHSLRHLEPAFQAVKRSRDRLVSEITRLTRQKDDLTQGQFDFNFESLDF